MLGMLIVPTLTGPRVAVTTWEWGRALLWKLCNLFCANAIFIARWFRSHLMITWWWLDGNICELLLDQMLGFSLHIVFFLIYQMHFYKARPAEQCMLDSFTLHWMKQMKFICLLFEKSTLNRIKFPILDPILEKKRVGAESQTRGGRIAHDLYSRKKGRWDQIGY